MLNLSSPQQAKMMVLAGFMLAMLPACTHIQKIMPGESFRASDPAEIADSIADDIIGHFVKSQAKPPIVLMVPVVDQTTSACDTALIDSRLRTEFDRSARVKVVRDSRIHDFLKKQDLSALPDDRAELLKAAKSMRADHVLVGAITQGKTLELTVDIVRVADETPAFTVSRELQPAAGK
jgi:hypothetical protein